MSAPDTLEFTFSTGIRFIPVAVTILFLALTIFLFRKRGLRRFGFIPLAIALIAGGLIAPALFRDRVSATATEITTTRGFWFAPSQEGFIYRDVDLVFLTHSRDPKGRHSPAWGIRYRDGHEHLIPLGDLWDSHEQQIMEFVKSHGVKFYGNPEHTSRRSSKTPELILLGIMGLLVCVYFAGIVYFRRKAAAAPSSEPSATLQLKNSIALLKIEIPELGSVSPDARERILTVVSNSQTFKAASHRYWNRPVTLAIIPVIPVAIYSGIKDIGSDRVLLYAVPVVLILLLVFRRYYKGRLIRTIRSELLAELAKATSTTGNPECGRPLN
jgi:hypothetical protein